jgi:hypothetical protein
MSTLTETVATANESALKAISTLQDQVLTFHREVSAAYAKVPTVEPVTAEQVTEQVTELVEQAYGFQTQRLEADQQFARDLVAIWAPKGTKPAKAAK